MGANLLSYDRDISSGTRAIEKARGDAQLAEAYTQRARAYSEKARYGRAFKLITTEEYTRLFGLALKDHAQAIALAPSSAEAYYNRGQTYYDRGVQEVVVNGLLTGTPESRKVWFAPAIADMKKAVEINARHEMAWDGLGLADETIGDLDQAILDYGHEMALNSLGKTRVADVYCLRAGTHTNDDAVIADYEKSVELGATSDGCSCDPYNPLLRIYEKDRQYDKVWEVVHRAWKSGKYVAPDLLAIVQKETGRKN
jgi:tetratricopeptide (TPR) repeat protein